jgi:glycosyltransferase involved in cell wall biosynthesis
VLDPLLAGKAGRLLGELAFDAVHAHHYEGLIAALYARRRRPRLPVIYDAHTLLASELPFYRLPVPARAAAAIGNWFDTKLPRRADHIIAVTERMRAWLTTAGGAGAAGVSLIPNGVEHEHFGMQDSASPGAGSPKGGGAPTIVFAGNLAEYQGIDLLLQSFVRLRHGFPDARLVLVTDSDPAELMQRVAGLGLAGCVSTVAADYPGLPARLAEADVLVNPRPTCEGVPQKLLNYMAAGRPIVSFAGSAALLEHERTALLVPDGNVEGFAEAMARVLREPELGQRLGRIARETVIAAHGWPQVAEKVEAVYARLASPGP